MAIHHSTIAGVMEAAGRVLEQYQVDASQLFGDAGVGDLPTRHPESRLPIETIRRFWALCAEATRNPCIGYEVGQAISCPNLGVLGYAWLSSATLWEAIKRFERYHRILTTLFDLEISTTDQEVMLTLNPLIDAPAHGRNAMMCMFVQISREVSDEHLNPSWVKLTGPPPPCLDDLQEYFGCSLQYDAPANQIATTREHAHTPLPRSSATMARLSDHASQRYLAELDRDDIISRVRATMLELLPDGDPGKAVVAARLSMSERTLTRRLASENSSYKKLLDELRRELAVACIAETNRSIIEIAFLLGFTDQSNFARAFKRWTGQSPSAYRAGLAPG